MAHPDPTATPVPFRGVKLNLPWNSYRVHPSLTRHDETMQSPEFWKRLIGFLGESGFNALTLWSIHPWSLMVRPEQWPEACPFDDRELQRWQSLWRLIFDRGRAAGIDVIPVCFNIFVSPELARSRGLAAYSADLSTGYNGKGDYSEEVRAYNRAIVREVLETYPQIGGLGVSQNERMEGGTLEEWQRWIADTYFDIAEEYLQDKTFIVRAHTRPRPEMTRGAIEAYPGTLPRRTLVDVKFNWSHGHASPRFHYMHEGASDEPLREPLPERYKLIYTIRNEDFFGLDYGSPSFMKALVEANRHEATAGYIIGSECLIPAQEYIVRPYASARERGWDYLFERQAMFWCSWGTILSDPSADLATVADRLSVVAGDRDGSRYSDPTTLLKAADLASRTANDIASSVASTWDFTHYSEGMIKGVRQDWFGQPFDASSPLLSIEELADARPLEPEWPSIRDWVAKPDDESRGGTSPPARIAALRERCTRALEILDSPRMAEPISELDRYDRACVRAWAHLGLAFAHRLQAAVELCRRDRGRKHGGIVDSLQRAIDSYRSLCETLDPWITGPYELLHLGDNFITETYASPMERFHHRDVLRLMEEELSGYSG